MRARQPARYEGEPSRKPEGGVKIETLKTSKHKLNVWGRVVKAKEPRMESPREGDVGSVLKH